MGFVRKGCNFFAWNGFYKNKNRVWCVGWFFFFYKKGLNGFWSDTIFKVFYFNVFVTFHESWIKKAFDHGLIKFSGKYILYSKKIK